MWIKRLRQSRHVVFRRRYVLLWAAVGILVPTAWVVWPFLDSPDPIIISRETTFLGEEHVVDGNVAYGSVLAEELREAGVPDVQDDPWMNQAAPYPKDRNGWQRIDWGVLPGGLYTSVQAAAVEAGLTDPEPLQHRAWSTAEYPQIAEVVSGNAAWYSSVSGDYTELTPVEWAKQEAIHPSRPAALLGPGREVNRTFARRFLLRAALRFGDTDVPGAFADVRFIQVIAARHRMDRRVSNMAVKIEAPLSRLVVTSLLTPDLWQPESVSLATRLPRESALDAFEGTIARDRLHDLSAIQARQNGTMRFNMLVPWSALFRPSMEEKLRALRLRSVTDWNAVMRAENLFYDDLAEAMRQPTPAQVLAHARSLINPADCSLGYELSQRRLWQPVPTTDEVIAAWTRFREQTVRHLGTTVRRDLLRQVIPLAALLAESRHRTGRFPETLSELKLQSTLPPVPDSLLIDPFSGAELEYQATEDGFVLRSVGYNQVRDETEYLELEDQQRWFPQDDEDSVWRWPLSCR